MTSKPDLCLIFHAYQPPYPAQDPKVVERIVRISYRPFFLQLLENNQKITLNINACLLETLKEEFPDMVDLIFECAENNLIEFLCSGYFHPIFPLLTNQKHRIAHIERNNEVSKEIIGNKFIPSGFFPPELAVSDWFIREVLEKDFKFIVVPSNSVPMPLEEGLPYLQSYHKS